MAKTKVSEWSSTPGNNTDIDSINIAENCPPSGINDAIRELMSQVKDWQAGTTGDSFNGPVGTTTAAAGAFTTLTTSGAVTHNGGTANGVAYLNGSKVLTSGSALQFDGSNLGLGVTPSAWSLGKAFELGVVGNGVLGRNTFTALTQNVVYNGGYKYAATTGYGANMLSLDAGTFQFFTAPSGTAGAAITFTQAMTLDASGNFLVGVTSTTPGNARGFSATSVGAGEFRVFHSTTDGSGDPFGRFIYNGTQIGSITQNGTTGVLYNLTSDYRLKKNPVPVTGAKEFINALQPKTWDWWDGSGKGVGFIAHEFMEVAKYSGNGKKDAVDDDGKPVYQSIQPSSSEVMANLVALIQEQQNTIDQLKARLDAANL